MPYPPSYSSVTRTTDQAKTDNLYTSLPLTSDSPAKLSPQAVTNLIILNAAYPSSANHADSANPHPIHKTMGIPIVTLIFPSMLECSDFLFCHLPLFCKISEIQHVHYAIAIQISLQWPRIKITRIILEQITSAAGNIPSVLVTS